MTQNDQILVRAFAVGDLQAAAEIERACFSGEAWSIGALKSELENKSSILLLGEYGGVRAGYASARVVVDEGYIGNVAVLPRFWRQGVGERLLKALCGALEERGARLATLEVRAGNQNAIALYAKAGFVRVGLRRGFYSGPKEDAILMTLYFDKKDAHEGRE